MKYSEAEFTHRFNESNSTNEMTSNTMLYRV